MHLCGRPSGRRQLRDWFRRRHSQRGNGDPATLSNSTFANNRAVSSLGESQGGAITNNAFGPTPSGDVPGLSVTNCSFLANRAVSGERTFVFGGAISNNFAGLTVANSA